MPQTLPTHPESQLAPLDNRAQRWVLVVAILGTGMVFIDGTVVNVALPALQTYFHATGSQVQWVVEAYNLFLAALILVAGSFGDIFGLKRLFLVGTAVFGATSILCGLATSIYMLNFARAAQGIGASMLVPGSLALISASFPEKTRGKAIGTWSGATAITAAIGPLLGGWLVEHASWRWIFFINIPLALVTLLITATLVPETSTKATPAEHDWAGALLATLGLGGTTYALIQSSVTTFPLWWVGLLGVVCLVAFFFVESRSCCPMIPLPLFRSRNFTGANLATLFLYAALGGVFFYLPLNFMQVHHYTPTAAGAGLLPFIFLIFLLSRWSGGLIVRWGACPPLVIGPLIVCVGLLLMLLPSIGGSYWTTFFAPVLVLGLGMAICVAPLTTVVMNAVSTDNAGSASGVNNATSRVAGLLAIALFGSIINPLFANSLRRNLDASTLSPQLRDQVYSQRTRLAAIETTDPQAEHAVQESFVAGFRGVMLASTLLSLLAAISAAIFVRTNPDAAATHPEPARVPHP